MSNDFLFELGCEELPSSAVRDLVGEFVVSFSASLDKAGLRYLKILALSL